MRIVKFVASSLVIGGMLFAASAAFAGEPGVTVQVPFAFTVGNTTVPAGLYEVNEQSADTLVLESLTSPATHLVLPVITRLSSGRESDARMVFDRVGQASVLSEVWIGGQDGYLVHAASAPHAR